MRYWSNKTDTVHKITTKRSTHAGINETYKNKIWCESVHVIVYNSIKTKCIENILSVLFKYINSESITCFR